MAFQRRFFAPNSETKKTVFILERVLMVDVQLLNHYFFVLQDYKETTDLLVKYILSIFRDLIQLRPFKCNECTVQFRKSESKMHQPIVVAIKRLKKCRFCDS